MTKLSRNLPPPPSLKPARNNQSDIGTLSRSYRSTLERQLLADSDSALDPLSVRRLGNRALKLKVDLLGLAKIHEAALGALEEKGLSSQVNDEGTLRSTAFFNSATEPIEENRFAASEATSRLKATTKTLTHRTEVLERSNKKLLSRIAHLVEVEKSLRTSEATTSLLLKQAREMQGEMRSLSRQLITAQEDERKRISRELHDVIAQTLAGINVRLAVLRLQSLASNEDFHEKIEITERLVEQSVEIVHRFASDLRPVVLDDIGLIPALKTCIDSFIDHYSIPVKLIVSPAVEELDSSSLTTLFRISQEALTNIGRHSKASHVKFDLHPNRNSFRMKISDDGQGFALTGATAKRESKRLGILGMRERAEMVGGSFQIDSIVGQGTVIQVKIPRNAINPAKPSKVTSSSPATPKRRP